jgi:sulfur relay (sulfurtransferase) complex TusBCD TusD component (DsrE family)
VKRFLKTFSLLIVSLFLLVTGVDATLGHLSQSPTQSSFTVYNEQGSVILAYNGDLSVCKIYAAKPGPVVAPTFLHRT